MRFPTSILTCLAILGCNDQPSKPVESTVKLDQTTKAPSSDFQSVIDNDGSITFLCEWVDAADMDSSYTFFDHGRAHLTVYGVGIFHHEGRYTIDETGKIEVVTGESAYHNQTLRLRKDKESLILISPTDEEAIVPPYRQVGQDENRQTVKMIDDWLERNGK